MNDLYDLIANDFDFGSHIEPDFDDTFFWESDEAPVFDESESEIPFDF